MAASKRNREPMTEQPHIEVKSWKPRDTVWIEFDSDGDLLFMDSYGYSIIIHKSDIGKALAWIEGQTP